jgi:SOS regulatory protein LexA
MSELNHRIRSIRNSKKLSGTKIAQLLGISSQYYYEIERGEKNLSAEFASKLADIFEVSSDYLLGKTENPYSFKYAIHSQLDESILYFITLLTKNTENPFYNKIESELWEVIERYSIEHKVKFEQKIDALSNDKYTKLAYLLIEAESFQFKFDVLEGLKTIAHKYSLWQNPRKSEIKESVAEYGTPLSEIDQIKIPILGSIAAGVPITRVENIEGYEYIEPDVIRGREAFALRVEGNSMVGDGICSGDVVIVVKEVDINPSDIAVVAVNGEEATLKRVKCQNDVCILMPSNSQMEPIIVPMDQVHIIGKVIQSRRRFE